MLKGFPKVYDCHIQNQDIAFIRKVREPQPAPAELSLIIDMCYVDADAGEDVIKKNIDLLTEIIRQEILPYLEKHTDIAYLASIYPEQYNWNALPDVQGVVKYLVEQHKHNAPLPDKV